MRRRERSKHLLSIFKLCGPLRVQQGHCEVSPPESKIPIQKGSHTVGRSLKNSSCWGIFRGQWILDLAPWTKRRNMQLNKHWAMKGLSEVTVTFQMFQSWGTHRCASMESIPDSRAFREGDHHGWASLKCGETFYSLILKFSEKP